MMVACQWNYSVQSANVLRLILAAPWKAMPPQPQNLAQRIRTRSSPIGPAEQDDGGSLYTRISRASTVHPPSKAERSGATLAGSTVGCHASKPARGAAKKQNMTYRPRSVSSLLMRLRAMALFVGVFWGVGCEQRVCFVESGVWC
jgi:hypothetical protein